MLLQQHQRKDSASSEVAGFLCISGRSSRISSVGSQGSGVSRLSAVSGVSRSPSPHKMLVETSFCGPKPLKDGTELGAEPNVEALEQVLLARKHDPTQVVLAEGVRIDTSTPKRKIVPPMEEGVSNGKVGSEKRAISATVHKAPEVRITRPSTSAGPATGVIARGIANAKLNAAKKEQSKLVVGVTPSGTEYVRINLKPDNLYPDQGVGPSEKLIDATDIQKKPVSLNLNRESRNPSPDPRTQSASPKPARQQALARDKGSRSPSPALNISRKSSFCSLFKSNKEKDGASPDSPTVRDRSRSRSKGRDSIADSQTGTPSKQKSVLAIFKPRRSGSKSKSSSPIDPEMSNVEFKFQGEQHEIVRPKTVPASYRPPGKEHLRYYDTPLGGDAIYIPLHTPPDEKSGIKTISGETSVKVETQSTSRCPPPPPPMPRISPSSAPPIRGGVKVLPVGPVVLKKTSITEIPKQTPKPKPLQKLQRTERIENADSSVVIPLSSPLDANRENEDITWSMEVHRHSSQESQETVISSTHFHSGDENSALPNTTTNNNSSRHNNSHSNGIVSQKAMSPVPTPGAPPPTPAIPTTREKKHILFTTKLGSGSEEGLFATQFSLSKTESLCSQLSEQTSVFNSPTEKDPPGMTNNSIQRSDTVIKREDSSSTSSSVVMRRKDSSNGSKRKNHRDIPIVDDEDTKQVIPTPERTPEVKRKDDPNTRLSRCVDPNEIIEAQKKLEALRAKKREAKRVEEERLAKEAAEALERQKKEHEEAEKKHLQSLEIPKSQSDVRSLGSSADGGSSGSEKDSEAPSTSQPSTKRLQRAARGALEEESTGLVYQESFEDELPYVPTTLPEERGQGIHIIPMRERASIDLKTCPVERPRSRTPMDPSKIDNYSAAADSSDSSKSGEKLKISLPKRTDSGKDKNRQRSPRRISNGSNKTWFEFTEGGGEVPDVVKRDLVQEDEPPPLPPRKPSSQQWVDFDNIPEKRKPPKRITTIPSKETSQDRANLVQYNYVNPEECQCECHETERETHKPTLPADKQTPTSGEEGQPLLEAEGGRSR